MDATTQRQQEDRNRWQLEGINAERQKIQARLAYLDAQEKELRGHAMTGTAAPTGGTAKGGTRKRKLSAEQRRRQSEAASARWARVREQKEREALASTKDNAVDTVPEPVDTVQASA